MMKKISLLIFLMLVVVLTASAKPLDGDLSFVEYDALNEHGLLTETLVIGEYFWEFPINKKGTKYVAYKINKKTGEKVSVDIDLENYNDVDIWYVGIFEMDGFIWMIPEGLVNNEKELYGTIVKFNPKNNESELIEIPAYTDREIPKEYPLYMYYARFASGFDGYLWVVYNTPFGEELWKIDIRDMSNTIYNIPDEFVLYRSVLKKDNNLWFKLGSNGGNFARFIIDEERFESFIDLDAPKTFYINSTVLAGKYIYAISGDVVRFNIDTKEFDYFDLSEYIKSEEADLEKWGGGSPSVAYDGENIWVVIHNSLIKIVPETGESSLVLELPLQLPPREGKLYYIAYNKLLFDGDDLYAVKYGNYTSAKISGSDEILEDENKTDVLDAERPFDNPDTGSFLKLGILTFSLIMASVMIVIMKKRKKVYKL